jgi:circadian clock protein KaiB
MKYRKPRTATEVFEDSLAMPAHLKFVLRLYVTELTPRSGRAIENIKSICEEHLNERYELEVIDLYKQPDLAKGHEIIAVPTLIKKLPPPFRRIIGDLSDREHVLVGLDLLPRKK